MGFTESERAALMIPPGWKEPIEVVDLLIPNIYRGRQHPNRPGDRRPETRAFVFHGTANLKPSADAKANAAYFARGFDIGQYYDKNGKRQTGPIELGSFGKGPGGLGREFRVASAHCICDRRRVTISIPFEERAQHAGDRPLPWTEKYRGMRPLALELLALGGKPAPNSLTYGIEIAMNDEIPGTQDWEEACMTARWWAVAVAFEHDLDLTKLPLLRHYDVTGKACPSPFVGSAAAEEAWERFKAATIALYKYMKGSDLENGNRRNKGTPRKEAPPA